ncbi:MAG TPA: hypothetical protein VM053_07175 [Gemmatimonadaceae bacterium]|nr:hypothetical protein [Gemmatimonadaceae bacterium]
MLPLVIGSVAFAQPVLLQINPHVGDTLNVRMNQRVEMTGTSKGCPSGYVTPRRNGQVTPESRLCPQPTRHMTTVMEVFSRAIVRKTGKEGALVTTITDSIRTAVASGSAKNAAPVKARNKNDEIDMRVAKDGGAEVIDSDASDELRAIFGQMPAVLSRKPVSPGDTWKRQMKIPLAGEAGATGLVSATFQLDSLGHNGDIAYISMRGNLSHDHMDGSVSELTGWLSGTMQLDRRLAWITDTQATIDATSTVPGISGGAPMVVHTRVTQQLKAYRRQ